MSVKTFEKFDDSLAEDLLDESNARDRLDLPSAFACSAHVLELLHNGATVNAKA